MAYIKQIFENKEYNGGKYNIFLIKEPKYRIIMSQNIIDKIINHIVSKYFLVDIFDKTLINENVATRVNKGTHYGIRLLRKYLNEIKLKNREFYILKFDISKYFYNIDHEIVKKLIRRKIKDKDVLNILDNIIDSTDMSYVNNNIIDSTDMSYVNNNIRILKSKEIEKLKNSNLKDKDRLINEIERIPEYKHGKGLPIGNMSSQILAILYLNELDHYIKETLKIKYYIRYMDDGILIHESKDYLKYCLKQIKKVISNYQLELNDKTKIYHIKEGFEFLGFRYYIKNNKVIMKVKNQIKVKFKRKMKVLNKLVDKKVIGMKYFIQVENSYLGHLHYGCTNKLIHKNIIEKDINVNATEVEV